MKFEEIRAGASQNDIMTSPVKIAIIGVGGGGSNAVDNMIQSGVKVNLFMAVNTDRQALRVSKATKRIQIGSNVTKGFGAGANPEKGRLSAEECREVISEQIKDMDLVFITAGMGGGTGTGAAPVIAEIAHGLGKLTIAFVTTPFKFEGEVRMRNALAGITKLREYIDSIIIIPNEKLKVAAKNMTAQAAFKYADDVLRQGVQATTDLIAYPGRINVDFADIRTVLENGGDAIIGIGKASGANRATESVKRAVNNPILGTSIEGATHAIVNIEGRDVTMDETDRAAALIKDACAADANIIYGTAIVPSLQDDMQVTIIATGFNKPTNARPPQPQPQQSSLLTSQPAPYPQPQPAPYPQTQPQPQPTPSPRPVIGSGFVSLDDEADRAWLSRLNNGKKQQ